MADTDFDVLLERARSGDAEALLQIARTYEADLRIAARVHLGPALRPYLDSVDIVQSVHRSLLRGLRTDRLKLDNFDSLIAMALTMVRHKVAKQWRRHRRQLRIDSRLHPNENMPHLLTTLTGRGAEPGRSAAANEAVVQLLARLNPADRRIMELRLQGWNTVEVAQQTGQSPEAVRIRLYRLRRRFFDEGLANDWL